MNESELIARVLVDDDRAAFGKLVLRHQSAVRNFLRHLTRGDAALADDLAQETFVQAYRGLIRFRGEASFLTWLLGIARNRWRNSRRGTSEHTSLNTDHSPEPTVEPSARLSDLQHDLASALQQLPGDEQLALHLGFQLGLSHGEIAGLLDWPLGTVKTNLARGKARLREILAPWNPQT